MFGRKLYPVATLSVIKTKVCRYTLDEDRSRETLVLMQAADGYRRAERFNGDVVNNVYPELLRWLRGAELPEGAVPLPQAEAPHALSPFRYGRAAGSPATALLTDAFLVCLGATGALLLAGLWGYAVGTSLAGLGFRLGAAYFRSLEKEPA